MRVASTDRWKDANGGEHSQTAWVDVIMSSGFENVMPYLRQGQKIFALGSQTLRVYSSQKDRCMKAGETINAWRVELLGGTTDDVPRELIDPRTMCIIKTRKYYCALVDTSSWKDDDFSELVDKSGRVFRLQKGGWVWPADVPADAAVDAPADAAADDTVNAPAAQS